jgi:CRISPR-associated endonuclease Cas3-HD
MAEHLAAVADRCASYAKPWGASRAARIAGLLHDLGKYSERFQRRLEGNESGVDHWSAGAFAALTAYRWEGIPIALAIQGHHIGLQRGDFDSLRELAPPRLAAQHPLGLKVPDEPIDVLLKRLALDGLEVPQPSPSEEPTRDLPLASMLGVRVLFSALTDADYLETEAHFEGDAAERRRYRPDSPPLNPERVLDRVLQFILGVAARSRASAEVNSVRSDLLASCLAAADAEPGLFTLTAPTGSGKTLAMLAFALAHARRHGLGRVITVIPYLTIIEQTVKEYRKALGSEVPPGYLLEHHSLAGIRARDPARAAEIGDNEEGATGRARLLSENWDAPVIVTTSVQMLESLFANRPAACRKLHRLAQSVILFDEVQALPGRLVVPTLGSLSELCARFGSTVVFSTATQPAFGHLDTHVRAHASTGWCPREVVGPSARLFERTRRVEVRWPDLAQPIGWEAIARTVAELGTALCIVNLKRHAAELLELLKGLTPAGQLFHLSTSMCPRHRESVLDQVSGLLEGRHPCILISTQCVEAGVDVDFPAVFRAFGPLDAIAQAAGRCNRNGRLPGCGEVSVFLPEDDSYPPGGGYGQAAGVTRMMLRQRGPAAMDLNDPSLFGDYYQRLYGVTHPETLNPELLEAIRRRDFPAVSAAYRLIDQDAVNVLVSYDTEAHAGLRAELSARGYLTRDWIRRARPYAVGLFRSEVEHTTNIEPAPMGKGGLSDEWYVSIRAEDYDPLLGFRPSPQFLL